MTINKLIPSKVRLRIIKQYIFNPNSQYHIRELVRILKQEVNAVRRELINLEHAGFLISQKQSNKICYSLNTNFVLLEDFRSIFHKEYGLGIQILKNRKQLGDITYAILTYTFITLSPSSESDLDLIIVGNPDLRVLDVTVRNAEDDLKKDIFYTVMSEKDWIMRKKRKDPQVISAILLPNIVIIGDRATLGE